MILTIVGTHGQPFNRLLEAVNAVSTNERRVYQTGHSSFTPQGECHDFLPYEHTVGLMQAARVVICHAGTGTVMSALQVGKCPVVAPRLKRFGEHVDDHQLELAHSLTASGLIISFMPGDDLAAKIEQAASQASLRQISPDVRLLEHLHQAVRASALRRSRT